MLYFFTKSTRKMSMNIEICMNHILFQHFLEKDVNFFREMSVKLFKNAMQIKYIVFNNIF